jgi:hypothetical protein
VVGRRSRPGDRGLRRFLAQQLCSSVGSGRCPRRRPCVSGPNVPSRTSWRPAMRCMMEPNESPFHPAGHTARRRLIGAIRASPEEEHAFKVTASREGRRSSLGRQRLRTDGNLRSSAFSVLGCWGAGLGRGRSVGATLQRARRHVASVGAPAPAVRAGRPSRQRVDRWWDRWNGLPRRGHVGLSRVRPARTWDVG